MLGIDSINSYGNLNFNGGRKKLPSGLEHNLEVFKNKMIADEISVTGYIAPEIRTEIENKIQRLKLQAKKTNPKLEACLIKPLRDAIKGDYDITGTYLALGEFEKKLSQVYI